KTLLVSPDAMLGLFPLAALPGKNPDTFLIEERAVAVVPVPQLLLEDAPLSAGRDLLMVGDIDFNAEPGAAAAGATPPGPPRRAAFPPLPGTGGDLAPVDAAFATPEGGRARPLRGGVAPEGAFRTSLPGCR